MCHIPTCICDVMCYLPTCSLLVQKGDSKQQVNQRLQENGENEVEDIYGSIYGVLDDPNEV